VKAVLAAVLVTLAAAVPSQAQQTVARMSASASVVMPVSVAAAQVAVSRSAGGVDVTRPLAVGGSVPWVLEVVEGASYDASARRLTRAGRPRAEAAAPAGTQPAAQPVTVRLTDAPPAGPRPVTYVVATIN
jgi:hypothetical protein